MTPYIVYAPPYHTGSAGIVVMHRFMQELKKKGMDVYTNQPVQASKWGKIPVAESMEEAIAIYPEIVNGNPFNSKKIVRYILNRLGFFGGPTGYAESDMLFVFSDYWNRHAGINLPQERVLYIPEIQESEWIDEGKRRHFDLWYRGRGTQPEIPDITDSALFVGSGEELNEDKQEWLKRLLNYCKVLYTYDVSSALIPIAILSGCRVKVIADPTKEPVIPLDTTPEKLRIFYRRAEEELINKMDKFIEITQGGSV